MSSQKKINDEYYVGMLKNVYIMYDVCVYYGRMYNVYWRYRTLVGSLNIMIIKS